MNAAKIDTPLQYPITLKEYTPQNPNNYCVIIASATGVKQNYYKNFAQFLSENHYTVYTFDYGGIGESRNKPLSKFKTTASAWAQNDFESIVKYVKDKNPESKLFIITHSIGGQLLGLVPSNDLFKGVIMVASQSGSWIHWKGFDRIKMQLVWYAILPIFVKIFGYLPSKRFTRMENLPKGMVLEWSKWCKSPNYHFDYIKNVKDHYGKINCPIVAYSIENDFYAPIPAVDWISSQFKNAQTKRIHLENKNFDGKKIGHFGVFQKKFSDNIWYMLLQNLKSFEKS